MAPPSENTATAVYSHCTNRFEHHTVADMQFTTLRKPCHKITVKFTKILQRRKETFAPAILNTAGQAPRPSRFRFRILFRCMIGLCLYSYDRMPQKNRVSVSGLNKWHRCRFLPPPISIIFVRILKKSRRSSKGITPNGGVKCKEVGKSRNFQPISRYSS